MADIKSKNTLWVITMNGCFKLISVTISHGKATYDTFDAFMVKYVTYVYLIFIKHGEYYKSNDI